MVFQHVRFVYAAEYQSPQVVYGDRSFILSIRTQRESHVLFAPRYELNGFFDAGFALQDYKFVSHFIFLPSADNA